MSVLPILLVIVLPAAGLLVMVLTVVTCLMQPTSSVPGVQRLQRTSTVMGWLGGVVGVLAAMAVQLIRPNDALVVPALVGLGMMLGGLAGDLICWRALRRPGVAGIETRRPVRFLRPLMLICVALTTVAFAAVATDQMRRASSPQWDTTCGLGSGQPFPHHRLLGVVVSFGWLMVVMIAGAVLITRRPRDASDTELVRWDDALRLRSAAMVTSGYIVGTLGLTALTLLAVRSSAGTPQCDWAGRASFLAMSRPLMWIFALLTVVFGLRYLWALVKPIERPEPEQTPPAPDGDHAAS